MAFGYGLVMRGFGVVWGVVVVAVGGVLGAWVRLRLWLRWGDGCVVFGGAGKLRSRRLATGRGG